MSINVNYPIIGKVNWLLYKSNHLLAVDLECPFQGSKIWELEMMCTTREMEILLSYQIG